MRIIGGSAGGRRLAVPPSGTRPTSDRVREAQFSALTALVGSWEGLRVLDLYAGSGALGLEALSRGASHATFVERDRRAARTIEANAAALGMIAPELVSVIVGDAAAVVAAADPGTPYDLVLVDPPYAMSDEEVREVLRAVGRDGWTADDAMAVIERSARDNGDPWDAGPDTSAWLPVRRRDYGDTALWYGRRTGRERP